MANLRMIKASSWLLLSLSLGFCPIGRVASAQTLRKVDLGNSRVYIFVGKTGLGHEHGVEGKLKAGTIAIGSQAKAGEIVFDMATFQADTEAARRYVGLKGSTSESTRRQVNANMLGSKVLDTRRFPTAKFQIDSAKPLNKDSRGGHPMFELRGRFTLHGKTRAIKVITETIEEKDGKTRIRGGFRIRQSDYGIKPFTKAFGAIGVADELRIYGELYLGGVAAATAGNQNGRGGIR